tara:strand:+ start:123 stop:497 length:375 start_codon:yes stop_codon:yes gene_type:complete
MGLNTTHNAFHGSYGGFNRMRQDIAKVWGGSYPPHRDDNLDDKFVYFPEKIDEQSGMAIFMRHSDCDGEISPQDCKKVADELAKLLPKLEQYIDDTPYSTHAKVSQFIEGCRLAYKLKEPLEFG